jgi:SH3 domain protein
LAAVLIGALAVAAGVPPATAETVYISDVLTVPLRSGPSTANRILHRGLPSGTSLEVLRRDEGSGYAQVRTGNGTEGWLPMQYLVSEPIARDQLQQANRRVQRLEQTIAELRGRLGEVQQDKNSAETTKSALEAEVNALQQELAEIKQVSASAMETAAANTRLTELNARLRKELDDMVAEADVLRENMQQRWLLIGGGLVTLGLILGVVIKARPRRSAWS